MDPDNGISKTDHEVIAQEKPLDLAKLLAHVTGENIHEEQDFGSPQGKEVW